MKVSSISLGLRFGKKPLFAKVQPEINLPVSGLTEPPLGEVELWWGRKGNRLLCLNEKVPQSRLDFI